MPYSPIAISLYWHIAILNIMSSTNELQQEQNAIDNLQFIEEEIEASNQYFKAKPGKTYVIKMDRNDRIVPVETDRFRDAIGNPIKRYECTITNMECIKNGMSADYRCHNSLNIAPIVPQLAE